MTPEQVQSMLQSEKGKFDDDKGRKTIVVYMRSDIVEEIGRQAKEDGISFSDELEILIKVAFKNI